MGPEARPTSLELGVPTASKAASGPRPVGAYLGVIPGATATPASVASGATARPLVEGAVPVTRPPRLLRLGLVRAPMDAVAFRRLDVA